MKIQIVIISLFFTTNASAVPGNLNDDCIVNFTDFAVMAESWLTTYDYSDLNDLTANWLIYDGVDGLPDVNNQAVSISTSQQAYIQLDANDVNDMTFRITSLPDVNFAKLYDPNGSDPNYSEPNYAHPNCVYISFAPTTLTADYVICKIEPNVGGRDTFIWDVNDGVAPPCGGVVSATVTLMTGAPYAYDSDEIANKWIRVSYDLAAIDDGEPCDLSYYIATLPAVGDLLYSEDVCDAITTTPYLLDGDDVYYFADSNADTSFTWYAYDGDANSNIATVTVDGNDNPRDRLCFNNGTTLILEDCNEIDLSDPCDGLAFYLRTRRKYTDVFRKRLADEQGYEMVIIGGRLRFNLYDTGGLAASLWSYDRIDDARWYNVVIYLSENYANVYVLTNSGIVQPTSEFVDINTTDYGNDANFVISSIVSPNNLLCDIDRLRFYKGSLMSFDAAAVALEERTITGTGLFAPDPNLRWRFDEGTGGTVTDDIISVEGVYDPALWESPASEYIQQIKAIVPEMLK